MAIIPVSSMMEKLSPEFWCVISTSKHFWEPGQGRLLGSSLKNMEAFIMAR